MSLVAVLMRHEQTTSPMATPTERIFEGIAVLVRCLMGMTLVGMMYSASIAEPSESGLRRKRQALARMLLLGLLG